MWGVYVLYSLSTGHLYTGITNDPERRVGEHNGGRKGAKRTRAGKPWVGIYWEPCVSKAEALRREYQIKQMTKGQKLSFIQGHNDIESKPIIR